MSRIVLGIGTSHSPLLTIAAETWAERALDDVKMPKLTLSDGRTLSYAQLHAERGDRHLADATVASFKAQHDAAHRALDRLADELEAAVPDLVVIVGDDQGELFGANLLPAIAMYVGEEIVMHPITQVRRDLPEWRQTASRVYLMDAPHRHPAAPAATRRLVEHMVDQGIDLGLSSQVPAPDKAGFGHAFGFIVSRLFRGRPTPIVPIMLNTYFPPNVPTAQRCHDMGRVLRSAIETSGDDLRVAIVASGGLSHFVTDATLDQTVLRAIEHGDADTLRTLPRAALRSGSSEILNWVFAAGALEGLSYSWGEYIPVYRTPAGTGVGLGFVCWRPEGRQV